MIDLDFKNMTLKQKIIYFFVAILVIIIAIIVIINVFFAKKELESKELKNQDIYINFSEEKFDFKGDIILDREDNVTNVKINGKKTKLYSEPVYFKNKKELILPTNYSITFPMNGKQNKINYYTSLKKIDNDYYLINNNLKFNMNKDFLFDGSDLYIFVNDSNVTFGDRNIQITPMSYVNYLFNSKMLYIYNYGEDKIYSFNNVDEDVLVISDYYKVNVSSDIIYVNKKEKLLMKNFNYLNKLK